MSSLRNQIKQNACYLEVRNIYWKRLQADTYIERNKRFHLLNETKCKFHVISLFEHFKKNYCISSMLQCKKFWCSSCHIGLNNRIEIYSGLTRTHLMSLSIISKRDEKVLKRFIKRRRNLGWKLWSFFHFRGLANLTANILHIWQIFEIYQIISRCLIEKLWYMTSLIYELQSVLIWNHLEKSKRTVKVSLIKLFDNLTYIFHRHLVIFNVGVNSHSYTLVYFNSIYIAKYHLFLYVA